MKGKVSDMKGKIQDYQSKMKSANLDRENLKDSLAGVQSRAAEMQKELRCGHTPGPAPRLNLRPRSCCFSLVGYFSFLFLPPAYGKLSSHGGLGQFFFRSFRSNFQMFPMQRHSALL